MTKEAHRAITAFGDAAEICNLTALGVAVKICNLTAFGDAAEICNLTALGVAVKIFDGLFALVRLGVSVPVRSVEVFIRVGRHDTNAGLHRVARSR